MPEKTVAQRLLIRSGYRILLSSTPPGFPEALGALPPDAMILVEPADSADLILVFTRSRQELESRLPGLRSFLGARTLLWVAYLKGTSGIKTDIHRDIIREYAASIGLEGIS
jgi:hypothetical protein